MLAPIPIMGGTAARRQLLQSEQQPTNLKTQRSASGRVHEHRGVARDPLRADGVQHKVGGYDRAAAQDTVLRAERPAPSAKMARKIDS